MLREELFGSRKSERPVSRAQMEHMKEVERANLAAANGPIDTPFLILVLLLTGIGLIMVVGGIVWFLTRILMAVAGIALVVGVIAVALYFVGSRKK